MFTFWHGDLHSGPGPLECDPFDCMGPKEFGPKIAKMLIWFGSPLTVQTLNGLQLRMAILSMEPGIHGYPTRRAWVWRADHAHGFHGADIQLLMGWVSTHVLPHGYPMDIHLSGVARMSVRHAILPRPNC
jgi:hypothetical protein